MRVANIRSLVFGSLMLGCLTGARPAAPTQSAPQWAVGDSWRVGAWHAQAFRPDKRATQGTHKLKGRMIGVNFQVTDIKKVGSTECYEVQVTFPKEDTGFQRCYRAYYDRDTRRLVRVTDVSVLPDGTTKDSTTDYPADSAGPTFADNVPSPVPFDWPDQVRDNVPAEATDATPQADKAGRTAQATVAGSQEDEVTLTKSSPKRESKVVQRWHKGEPWWRLARKYENGQLVSEAVLLELNGNKIADAPKETP